MNAANPMTVDALALQAWATGARERGRAAWPTLVVSEEELIRIAAACRLRRASCALPFDLHTLDAAELYLAAACARGDPAGLRALRGRYFDGVVRSLQRMGVAASQYEDIWQILCERLLVSEAGAPPRIVRYAGAGELKSLMRVSATRVALNWRVKADREVSDDGLLSRLPADTPDPELHEMKRQHRAALKEELAATVAGLSTRDRMVLRFHLVERLGVDAIAAICSVHRATAARMVAQARDRLALRVRARLVCRWQVVHADLAALKLLVDSQLDLSLPRLLVA